MNPKWSVTTTTSSGERHWGVRLEWLGMGFLLAVQVNRAPAVRFVVCGMSIYAGRLLAKPKTIRYDLGEIAASKGWTHVSAQ